MFEHSSPSSKDEITQETIIEDILKKVVFMRELFITAFDPEGAYYLWLKKQNELAAEYRLSVAELDRLEKFSLRLREILLPNGFADEDAISKWKEEIIEIEKKLKIMKRADNEKEYDDHIKRINLLSNQIKSESFKLADYNEYKQALLGANKMTGSNKEAEATVREKGIAEGNTENLKKLLKRKSDLRDHFSQNLSTLTEIGSKFKSYLQAEVWGYNPERKHPLFPTLEEAQKNKKLVYSDHLKRLY